MVGGNLTATVQIKTLTENDIGEKVAEWTEHEELNSVKGWLDLVNGNSTRQNHKTKSEESTHIWICDFDSRLRELDITQCRFVCRNQIYEIKHIDDPMELHDHLEISLKLVGVVNAR